MSQNLNSPTINKAIGKLVAKQYEDTFVSDVVNHAVRHTLDNLGYLGVLNYSLFDPEKFEQALQIGNHVLEVETTTKNEN